IFCTAHQHEAAHIERRGLRRADAQRRNPRTPLPRDDIHYDRFHRVHAGCEIRFAIKQDLATLRRLEILRVARQHVLLPERLDLLSLAVADPHDDRGLRRICGSLLIDVEVERIGADANEQRRQARSRWIREAETGGLNRECVWKRRAVEQCECRRLVAAAVEPTRRAQRAISLPREDLRAGTMDLHVYRPELAIKRAVLR